MVTFSNPLRTFAHTPNFSASLGHLPGFGFGFGFGGQPPPHALAKVKKRTLKQRKRAIALVVFLEAMAKT